MKPSNIKGVRAKAELAGNRARGNSKSAIHVLWLLQESLCAVFLFVCTGWVPQDGSDASQQLTTVYTHYRCLAGPILYKQCMCAYTQAW